MPWASQKNCARGGCAKASIYGRRYCQEHTKQKDKADYDIYRRNDAGQKIYKTKLWANTRKDVLHYEPFCRECAKSGIETLAVDVDHIKPIAQGGDPWDRGNMQPLCRPCHARKTASEVGFGAKGKS